MQEGRDPLELKHTATRHGRLSELLRQDMGLSAGLMNRLKWQDRILVNGHPEHTNFSVCPGDVVTALLDDAAPEYPAEEGPLDILWEDEHLLAVDKPAGMLIHPSRSCNTGTLANLVAGYYRRTGQACAFHPVTRLDRDTFGIVLLAKNAHIHALMNLLHQEGQIQKTYQALVYGSPDPVSGTIDAPIARRPLPSLLRYIHPEGKPSVTEYVLMASYGTHSLVSLRPVTGRTHQLRLHCAHMGFPILGDPQYGTPESQAYSVGLGYRTQMLCACNLAFPHPVTKIPVTLRSRMVL